jgi:hypothetical protein
VRSNDLTRKKEAIMTATNPDPVPEIEPGQAPVETPPPMTEPMPDTNQPSEIPPSPDAPEIRITHIHASGAQAAMSTTGEDIADDRPDQKGDEAESGEVDNGEADNSEQDDEPSQAQTVSEDALDRTTGFPGGEDSDKSDSANIAAITPDDTPDLIDTMEKMQSSGHIDYGAFAGERNDDDEASTYGDYGDEDRDIKLSDE